MSVHTIDKKNSLKRINYGELNVNTLYYLTKFEAFRDLPVCWVLQ